jgi:hypothetical protein
MNTLRCTGVALWMACFSADISAAADLSALQSFFDGQAIRPTLAEAENPPLPASKPLEPIPVPVIRTSKPANFTPDERIVIAFQSASEAE